MHWHLSGLLFAGGIDSSKPGLSGMQSKKRKSASKPISLQALEQRYLLDAAAAATLVGAASDTVADSQIDNALQQLPTYACLLYTSDAADE